MCRPIKGADRQTNHVVARTGKVLSATRAHLSSMELMVVLSFSGLRGVGHFVKGLLKRWFAHKSSNPKMPSVCVCVVVPSLLRPSTFSFHARARAHTRAHANERSLRTATADILALTSNQAAPSAAFTLAARYAWSPSRVYLQRSDNGAVTTAQGKRRYTNGAVTTRRSNNGAATTAQRQRRSDNAAATRRSNNGAATTAQQQRRSNNGAATTAQRQRGAAKTTQ
jgi:hypothetical protein